MSPGEESWMPRAYPPEFRRPLPDRADVNGIVARHRWLLRRVARAV